jgi:hypothetical protein
MGRPLNKRYFGPPTAGGDEIKVQFHNETSSVPGWIVKQTGSKRFICSDGSAEAECYLTDKAAGDLLSGEMSITLRLDDSSVVRAVKIAGRKFTANNGSAYPWNFDTDFADGAGEVEEAGDDSALTNADNFEGDVE